ncbi:hypothetical protein [Halorussus sp. MSC15.2]|uniref:hypothetical protein n=1 Tax=Halorussus sp. MSC15.2 TaxID=2283638 RepID=UPI0013D390E6|nr:hypothetical protein [Halorussus sp. MSC15.2]NEU58142.1 hypothetical protein [Halorussus sp. MSC15.2]
MSRYTAADDPDDDVENTERLRIDESDTTDERVTADEGSGDGFWDVGVAAALAVVGAALVLFPEPATTVTGFLLLAFAISLVVLDALT